MRKVQKMLSVLVVLLMLFTVLPGVTVFAEGNETEPNPYGAQDYFLDATGGSDDNDGTTPETAWKSLAMANATTFQPGDRILLKAGEVWENQQLIPKGSGVEGKPITIDMYGDSSLGRPYIATNGNVARAISGTGDRQKITDTVGLTGAISLRNQQYWEIHNMELSNDDNFDVNITSTSGNPVRDGISISINADIPGEFVDGDTIMNYFRISNCYIHDIDGPSTWQKIHYGGINFQVFGNNTSSAGDYTKFGTGGYYFQDVRIENNSFYKCELHAIQFGFNWFYDRSGSHGEYDDSGKYHEGWEQLWVRTRDLYSRDVYIGNNYAESTGQGAIQLANIKNLTCEYNEVNGFLKRYNQVSAGLYLWAGADSVMQFNEVYDGPANEYDATPWDLEYTNFNVTYQYNYSHDNLGGWMSYMGNSSNSIARYNLSINDNGVLWKNMLSTNYAPTYCVNNVFIYDGSKLGSFHDEVLKDTVYFYNNIFYNYSATTSTNWARRSGGLANGVFYNNAYYEASGNLSGNMPEDKNAVIGDPMFVSDPLDYVSTSIGVQNIRQVAANYKLQDESPLIDAGHWSPASGTEDFFETHLYYGDEVDIGLYEAPIGVRVDNPVEKPFDTDPENPDRINLALNKPITASSTHTNNGKGGLEASKLVDGNLTTRWASADNATFPLNIDIDFEATVTFDEVFLSEFQDNNTNLRINNYILQYWDAETEAWVTFKSVTGGMGISVTLDDFGSITTTKMRLSILSKKASETYTPTMNEIMVYGEYTLPVGEYHPELAETVAVFDQNAGMAGNANNAIAITFIPDGDTVSGIEYYGPEGNKLRDLSEDDHYTVTDDVYTLSPSFLATLNSGACTILFTTASGVELPFVINMLDTTELAALIDEATALATGSTDADTALRAAIATAQGVLDKANRIVAAVGNSSVDFDAVESAAVILGQAIDVYESGGPGVRVNLALNKPITASSTHPRGDLEPEMLVDGLATTRWACADPTAQTYPITIEIDFEAETKFNEIYLDEFTDHETNPRIENFELQYWNGTEWITFKSVTGGMGHDLTIKDFGTITGSKLRLVLTKQFATEYWTPSMTEIQVYYDPALDPGDADYIVSLTQDQAVAAGANATVGVSVTSSTKTAFNAMDLTLSYDSSKLEFVGLSDTENYIASTATPGQVRIYSYGQDKTLGEAVLVHFKAIAANGSTDVTVTAAKVDEAANAGGKDAPDAGLNVDKVTITISGYNVTLGEYLTGSPVAAPNADYTFSAIDSANYDYTVTVTVGGVDISAQVVNNGDGTYTIPGAYVTGDIVANATRTPKSWSVTFTGNGAGDVTGAAGTATYATDYSFTLNKDAAYTYDVTMTVGGATYTGFGASGNVYTIPGTDITGNVAINITKTRIPSGNVNITFEGNGAGDATGNATAPYGEDYTFSLDKTTGYSYTIEATRDGEDIDVEDNEDGTYTIAGEDVIDDIIITITKTSSGEVEVYEYVKLNGQSMFLVLAKGELAAGSVYTYDGNTMYWSDKYEAYAYLVITDTTLSAEDAADEIAIATGTAEAIVYDGDVNGTGLVDINDAQLAYDMYNAKYEGFDTVSMMKFLSADMNGDYTLNVMDATAIVAIMLA